LAGICTRRRRKEARPSEIVEAARQEFVARGFGASKVEEIAARAGVSKGTVYLYFPTKEALFEAVMRANVLTVIEGAAAIVDAGTDVPAPALLRFLLETMYRELVGTDRRRLMHLIIAEGPHFPQLLDFYHREVVTRGMEIVRRLVERGAARGEFDPRGLDRHPKLILGPALMAALYSSLFGERDPIDLEDYAQAHIGAVMRSLGVPERDGGPAIG
jgi:AcrR family transcriptional regulator